MTQRRWTTAWAVVAASVALSPLGGACADPIVFPPDAGVVNVRDHGAKGDGRTDDTQAIQAAMDEAVEAGTSTCRMARTACRSAWTGPTRHATRR